MGLWFFMGGLVWGGFMFNFYEFIFKNVFLVYEELKINKFYI